jgi:hypothetical protein
MMLRMQESGPDVLTRTGQLAGLLAGAVGALYVTGGQVLLIRLWVLGSQPPLDLPTRLPRELLISTGLLVIAVPVFVVAMAYLAWRSFATPRLSKAPTEWNPRVRLGLAAGWGLVVGAVGACYAVQNNLPANSAAAAAGFGVLAFMLASFALVGRNSLGRRCRVPSGAASWGALGMTIAAAALAGMPAIPFGLILQTFAPLQAAKVCTEKDEVVGILIGDGADRIIVGEVSDDWRLGRLISTSNDHVRRVWIARQKSETVAPEKLLTDADCVIPKRETA